MSNATVYGEVVSVCMSQAPLIAVLPCRPASASVNQASLSQPQWKQQLLPQPSNATGGAQVAELRIRDARGEARILCCGREAVVDALRCR